MVVHRRMGVLISSSKPITRLLSHWKHELGSPAAHLYFNNELINKTRFSGDEKY